MSAYSLALEISFGCSVAIPLKIGYLLPYIYLASRILYFTIMQKDTSCLFL